MIRGYLYNDGKIKVSYFRDSTDMYALEVVRERVLLSKEVFVGLSNSFLAVIRNRLSMLKPSLETTLSENNLPWDRIGSALATARFNDQIEERKRIYSVQRRAWA